MPDNDQGIRAVVCMSAFGCMLEGSVIGSGKEAREAREVDNFTQLEFLGVGRIEVTIGNLRSLELSGDDNILPMIETKVTDGRLVHPLDAPRAAAHH